MVMGWSIPIYTVLCRNLIVFWCIYALFCMSSDIGWSNSPYVEIQCWEDFSVWILDENAAAQYVTWFCTVLHGNCMVIYGCYGWTVDGDVNVPYVDSGLISGCFGWILDCYDHDLCDLLLYSGGYTIYSI